MAQKKTAGAFDIRNVLGALLGIYGIILLLMAAFGPLEEDKTGGVNANLWIGIVLVVAGGVFVGWARLRPVVVEDQPKDPDQSQQP
jgi:drug/metabolite transporter (DMT)-like permease